MKAIKKAGHEHSYWDGLTDAQLLERNFTADDPTTLEGMRFSPPEGQEVPVVEFAYNVKGTLGRLIRCVHCPRENHYRGFVLRFRDGSRVIVGKDCGKTLYQADFESELSSFRQARDRAFYLDRQRKLRLALPHINAELARILADPSVIAFDRLQRRFFEALPDLAAKCQKACASDGGAMRYTERVRDIAAEHKRDGDLDAIIAESQGWTKTKRSKARSEGILPRATGKRGQAEPIWKFVDGQSGILSGQGFFIQEAETAAEILGRRCRDFNAKVVPATEAGLSLYALRSRLSEAIDVLNRVVAEVDRIASTQEAFSARNLDALCRWSSKLFSQGIACSYGHDWIEFKGTRVTIHADNRPPDISRLKELTARILL